MMKISLIKCILFFTSFISGGLCLPAVQDPSNSYVLSSDSRKQTPSAYKDNAPTTIPKIYEMRVDSNITNRFATTLVTSKVKNHANTAQEATFIVVLPETAYITNFTMEIAGKEYKAYIKEKEEANQIYNAAIQSGQAAAHVSVRDSSRFTVSVNVEPQTKAVFKLTYEELLQRQSGQYELVVNINPGQPVKDLSVQVNINETRPLKFVHSPSLRTGNKRNKNDVNLQSFANIQVINNTATVKFDPDIVRQQILATALGTEKENGLAGQFVVQYDVERDSQGEILINNGYFVHFFAPQELPIIPKYVVFVLDTSASMRGGKIKQLQAAMNNIIDELRPEDMFNIADFGSYVYIFDIDTMNYTYMYGNGSPSDYRQKPPLSNTTLPPAYAATEKNKDKTKKYINILNIDGGTDINAALEVGLKLVENHRNNKSTNTTQQSMIIFLTDGEATVGEYNSTIIDSHITELNRMLKVPIYTLSFGSIPDRNFLKKMSFHNYGFERHIYEESDASLQIVKFYHEISSPLLQNVKFMYVNDVDDLTNTDHPQYSDGSELVVAGRIKSKVLRGVVHGISSMGEEESDSESTPSTTNIQRMWAYLTLKQKLEELLDVDKKEDLISKAVGFAIEHNFVSPVTSLVVVKPNSSKAVNIEDASNIPTKTFRWHENAMYYVPKIKVTDLYGHIKKQLPWISNILNKSGTLSSPPGNYKLSTDADTITIKPECPKVPINGTSGICTLLPQCPQVFDLLTNEELFHEYFCPLGNFVGICCPK